MQGLLVLISIFAFIISSPTAFACRNLTLEASLANADIAFVGTLKAVSKRPETLDRLRPSDAVFEITQVVKGHLPQSVAIRDVGNNCYGLPQFSMEGYGPPQHSLDRTASREYLVFATRDNDGSYKKFHPLGNTWMTDEKPFAEFKEQAASFIRRQLERLSEQR
ncbi:MAG: hypothetical protein H7X91_09575 [Burkholderiales bacterium]|nr:hypothetical protein [Burkholderiales bacterium]